MAAENVFVCLLLRLPGERKCELLLLLELQGKSRGYPVTNELILLAWPPKLLLQPSMRRP